MTKFSEYVREHVDSHGLIDLKDFLEAAVNDGAITDLEQSVGGWAFEVEGKRVHLRGQRVRDLARRYDPAKVGPKGLYLDPDIEPDALERQALPGWTMASVLAQQLTGSTPGDQFMGRGTAFRANLRAIAEAGL